MKFVVDKKEAIEVMEKCSGCISQRDVPEIQTTVALVAGDGQLVVTATNLEVGVQTAIKADISEAGGACLPFEKLNLMVSLSPGKEVVFASKDANVRISSRKAVWNLVSLPIAEFPFFETEYSDDEEPVILTAKSFGRALGKVMYAMSVDETRSNLMAVSVGPGRILSTDGHRVGICGFSGVEAEFYIPRYATSAFSRVLNLAYPEAELLVGSDGDRMLFCVGDDVFYIRAVQIEYPDVDEALVAPVRKNPHLLKVRREPFFEAIRRVGVVVNDENQDTSLLIRSGKLVIRAQDNVGNKAAEEIPARWEGEDRDMIVGHRLLLEAITSMDGDEIEIFLGDDLGSTKAPLRLVDSDVEAIVLRRQ